MQRVSPLETFSVRKDSVTIDERTGAQCWSWFKEEEEEEDGEGAFSQALESHGR